MADTDLFGQPVMTKTSGPGRPAINDMALIEDVLKIASQEGYALIGIRERVWRVLDRGSREPRIEKVPDEIDTAVHQLIDTKWLTVGGYHTYWCGSRNGPGRAVLVPKSTKEKLARWRNLRKPATWQQKQRERTTA